jgi:glycerol-3-phosphate dehydrogenase
MSREEQDALSKRNPKYGRVVCRCETITEGEILDAIRSPIVPVSIDAIKRRTRAGMGRCQGGFCQQKVIEILARELGKEWTDINLKDEGSYILRDVNRKDDGALQGGSGVRET